MTQLAGRIAIVTGASRGIGLEMVAQYRAEGAAVTGTARDDVGLARLRDLGATALTLDVASAAGASAPRAPRSHPPRRPRCAPRRCA